jgi:phage-related protein
VKYSKKLEIVFYKTDQGNEPVREWLQKLFKADKKIIGEDIKTVQYGWPLGMPLVRNMGNGLWEIRSSLRGKIARVLFCMHESMIVLLHGFIKKTQKTPSDELKLAMKRMRTIKRGKDYE